jgi:DNA-binding protein H-NS
MPSLKDLIAQKEELERQIERTVVEERSGAIEKVRALMSEYGLTAADLSMRPPTKSRASGASKPASKVAAKYRNRDTGETWSGRGLQPKWLRAALQGGRTIDEFAV